jgi:hypothetical protein
MRPRKRVEAPHPGHGVFGTSNSTTNDTGNHHEADTAQASSAVGQALFDALRRRRAAADDMRPLASGRRDPWWYEPPGARGYQDAAMHLLEHGLLPAPDREGLKLMRGRGGSCRQAAERIAKAWELAA